MQNSDTLHSRKKRWHFSVEKDFVCDRSLSPMARMLYLVLTSYASPTSPVPFPGMHTLSTILQCTEDTIRKYRVELERANWLVVERRRDGHQKWLSNAYILLDGPEDAGAMPKKPDMAFSGHGENPTPLKPGIKRVPVLKEENQVAKRRNTSSNNTGPSGTDAPAAAPTPSAASKAESVIQAYKERGPKAGIPATMIIPRERAALVELFTDNSEMTARHLIAIMLYAWTKVPLVVGDHDLHWHCHMKGRRMGTFLKFLTEIQDELEWKGTEEQIERVFQKSEAWFQEEQPKAA